MVRRDGERDGERDSDFNVGEVGSVGDVGWWLRSGFGGWLVGWLVVDRFMTVKLGGRGCSSGNTVVSFWPQLAPQQSI